MEGVVYKARVAKSKKLLNLAVVYGYLILCCLFYICLKLFMKKHNRGLVR